MASFQVKIGWKGQERDKINIIVPIRSNPTRYKNLKKNSKRILKIKKHHYGFFSRQNWLEMAEKERK